MRESHTLPSHLNRAFFDFYAFCKGSRDLFAGLLRSFPRFVPFLALVAKTCIAVHAPRVVGPRFKAAAPPARPAVIAVPMRPILSYRRVYAIARAAQIRPARAVSAALIAPPFAAFIIFIGA